MLPQFKKSHERSDGKQFLAWHPSFADTTRLPDVKVVRTTFFINSASIVALGSFLVFFGNREFTTYQIQSELSAQELEIKTSKIDSDRAVSQYTKYKEEAKKLAPVVSMNADPFVFSDFMVHLANALPERMMLERVVYKGVGQPTLLTMTVQGLDSSSVEMVSAYVKEMQADEYYKESFGSVILSSIVRNAERSTITLEIAMNAKSKKK